MRQITRQTDPRILQCVHCLHKAVTRKPYGYSIACAKCHRYFTDAEAEDAIKGVQG